jgi:hypothetical protein
MEEEKWLIPVCHDPVAVGDQGNCADSWDPSLIFDPSFAENQPLVMTLWLLVAIRKLC